MTEEAGSHVATVSALVAIAPEMADLLARIMDAHDDDSGFLAEWRSLLIRAKNSR